MNSKTMNCRPSSSPRSITVTMFGCESCATARASRRKRSTCSSSRAELLVQDLQRDVALEQRVEGAVDARHAAAADELLELVPVRDELLHSHRNLPFPTSRETELARGRARARLPRRASASSSSASVITSGQRTRMSSPCTPAFSSSSPRCIAASITAWASSGAGSFVARSATSSIASIAPRPRTSPIAGKRSCQASMRARIVSPIATARSHEPLLVDHVEDGERRGLRDGVADVRAADGAVVRRRP